MFGNLDRMFSSISDLINSGNIMASRPQGSFTGDKWDGHILYTNGITVARASMHGIGASIHSHTHEVNETIVITKGACEVTVGATKKHLFVSDTLFIPAMVPHSIVSISPDCEAITVWVPRERNFAALMDTKAET